MENEIRIGFKSVVEQLVKQIPKGKVMTYGQIASICGNPRAARIVGGIAHYGDTEMPWQRVVNKHGGLASGYPGGRASHEEHLLLDGVMVSKSHTVDLSKYLWSPRDVS